MAEIRHVFVLMLENRSFDHIFGLASWRSRGLDGAEGVGVDGLANVPPGLLPDSIPEEPYSIDFDPGHEFPNVVTQLCGPGATYRPGSPFPDIDCSGFLADAQSRVPPGTGYGPEVVIGAFRPGQLPVLSTLAQEFALCERWFSSMPGPTWPNRLFVHAATSGGLDSSPTGLQALERLTRGYEFEHGTVFDRLTASGLPWLVVEGDALPQALCLGGMLEHALEGRFTDMEDFLRRLQDPAFDACYTFIEPRYGHVLADGRNFKCGSSMHPLDDVTRGEALVKRVYEAIRNSPHWEQSLLLITFDEHGGFFDHVHPPAAVGPGDTPVAGLNHHGFAFDRLGVRVPAIVVSAHVERGLIDRTQYEHASIPRLLGKVFGLSPLTARDAAASTPDHLLTLAAPRDCLAALPNPAVSGLSDCGDGADSGWIAELDTAPAHLAHDYEPALAGFLQVALARELHIAASVHGDVDRAVAREGERLRHDFASIANKFDAVRMLRQVEEHYAQWKAR